MGLSSFDSQTLAQAMFGMGIITAYLFCLIGIVRQGKKESNARYKRLR